MLIRSDTSYAVKKPSNSGYPLPRPPTIKPVNLRPRPAVINLS
jgi:hypothetical protein